METFVECLLKYRQTLRQQLAYCGVASNPGVTDDWILDEISKLLNRRQTSPVSRKCVLKDWVQDLTLQMQGTLLCAMRGPDGSAKNDPAKALVRAFRAVITHNALPLGPRNSFAGDGTGIPNPKAVEDFFDSIDQYQHHWYAHFSHAAEIVGYFHPDSRIADFWLNFYHRCCHDAHLNPETKEQLTKRLRGNGN